jgi:hypothetical protein
VNEEAVAPWGAVVPETKKVYVLFETRNFVENLNFV